MCWIIPGQPCPAVLTLGSHLNRGQGRDGEWCVYLLIRTPFRMQDHGQSKTPPSRLVAAAWPENDLRRQGQVAVYR